MLLPEAIAKQKLGKLYNVELTVDFNDLFQFKGERKTKNRLDKIIASVIFIIGILFIAIPAVTLFLEDSFKLDDLLEANSLMYVIPAFSVYCFYYSIYLSRNKNRLGSSWEINNLRLLVKKIKRDEVRNCEIENYYSEDVLEIIDEVYYSDKSKFILLTSEKLLNSSFTKFIFEKRLGINYQEAKSEIIKYLISTDLSFDKNHQMFFLNSFATGIEMELEKIDKNVFLFFMLKYYWKVALRRFQINDLEIEGLRLWYKNLKIEEYYRKLWDRLSRLKPVGAINRSFTSRITPLIDQYGYDLTSSAVRNDEFITTIGKENAMSEILRTLQKETGAASLIVGQPGVGRTRLLKHLATRMVVEDVPEVLKDKRLIVIDLNTVMAQSESIDNFKNIVAGIFEEIIRAKNIVLAFEEIGQIFSIREEGQMEIINLITNLLDKQRFKIVATSTFDDYTKRIKTATGFASLFDVIQIPEPDKTLNFQILMDYVTDLEDKSGLSVEIGAVQKIVEIGPKIMLEKSMPDKGIQLLEEAAIAAKSRGLRYLTEDVVNHLLESKTGVKIGNISKEESSVLQNIEQIMHNRVIGQSEAINGIAAALRRSRAGLTSGKRPVASFLFYGPTGVGKTEVAKTLAETYFGDEKLMIRLDMSEYQEEDNLDRLIGYTDEKGDFIGGFLTDSVRSKPFSLILLDEIEKANKKVLDLFLQVLDDGRMTDGMGRVVDFTNSILIATSNAGSRQIADGMQKGMNYQDLQKFVHPALLDIFRVEFLNRFDQVIMFKHLTKIEIQQIAGILLEKLKKNLLDKSIDISWNDKTLMMLAEKGYDPVYGARELRRIVQETIEDAIAKLIVSNQARPGSKVMFDGLTPMTNN